MNLSIIIPTYNRANTLLQCLTYLQQQSMRGFEVIIVDDGSTDDTQETVTNFSKDSWLDIHYFYQKNQKQGAARNLGIIKAKGDIILFLGDDIFALPHLIENHLAFHQCFPEKNIAVLGHTTWAPFLEINDYMHFLEWSGWQFNYNKIQDIAKYTKFPEYKKNSFKGKFLPPKKQYWFFYTSNLSLKRELLLEENFDEKFKAYGWEDVELGQRLTQKKALHLFYNPDATAYHSHVQTEDELEPKIKNLAKSLKKAPQLKPKYYKVILFKVIFNPLTLLILNPFLSYNCKLWFKAKKIFYNNL